MALHLVDDDDAVEPLDLEIVKLQLKLPACDAAYPENSLLEDTLIPAVRDRAEVATCRQLRGPVTYELRLDGFGPGAFIEIPRPPLLQVLSVKYLDTAGVLRTLVAGTDYVVSAPLSIKPPRGRVALAAGRTWPSTLRQVDAVRILFRCGYGADDGPALPAILRAAMLLDAATLYANREGLVSGTIYSELPGGRRSIYWSWRSHATQRLAGVMA